MEEHAPDKEQIEGPQMDFNDVFSLRKPKDAKAGFSSGLKSIAKGVLGGAAGLIAAPVLGAQKDGVTGFAKGLATGVVGAVVLPVTGVGVGAVQIVRGVINQPEAIAQGSKGKIWDERERLWIEKGAIVACVEEQAKGQRKHNRPKSGDDYYEILQVPHDATPEQIKKQYYLLARKWHPDKNPGDATAHDRFQKLGEAYQVLGNDELRQKYDEHGAEGLDVNFMDGGEFFNMLFGSDLFEHLVGELLITAAARAGGEFSQLEVKRSQLMRIETLTVNLKTILKRYGYDEEGFKLAMKEEADRLVLASFGETMLMTIGKVYEMQADIVAGGFFGSTYAKWKASGETMRSQFQAASAAIKVYAAQQKVEQWQKEQDKKAAVAVKEAAIAAAAKADAQPAATEEGVPQDVGVDKDGVAADEATPSEQAQAAPTPGAPSYQDLMEKQKLEEAALPLMLEAMWAANVLDIQTTLRKVCRKVLLEEGVDKLELQTRAKGLKTLGILFQATKAPLTSGATQDARKQMEDAMLRVVEKRAQQEGQESHQTD